MTPFDMDNFAVAAEFAIATKQLLEERDRLENELAYCRSAVDALRSQNERYCAMLRSSVSTLDEVSDLGNASDMQWVAGNFLYQPSVDLYLKESIDVYQHNSAQRAIALLSLKISTGNLTDAQRVNAQLLLTAIMRSSGTNSGADQLMEKALMIADDALQIAEKMEDHSWACKAHFHRGHCYLHLRKFADAHWSFILASGAEGYSELAELQRQHVHNILDGLMAQESTRMHLKRFLPDVSNN